MLKHKVIWFFSILLLTVGCQEKEGTCSESFENGQIKYAVPCNLSTGEYNGLMKIYNRSGDLYCTKMYVNDLVEDTMYFFYSRTGELLKKNSDEGRKKGGDCNRVLQRQHDQKTTTYRDGLKNGIEKVFDESGRLMEEKTFGEGGPEWSLHLVFHFWTHHRRR